MKKIVIVYAQDNRHDKYPISEKKYRLVAELMGKMAEKKEIAIYHASIYWFEKDTFKSAWIYKNNCWTKENITPDFIWLRMKITPQHEFKINLMAAKFPFINSLGFERLNNKAVLGNLLSPWMPKTIKINHQEDYPALSTIFNSKKIVLKPIKGSGGVGVEIIDAKKITRKKNKKVNVLAQEFIDSSKGIKGLCSGYHDLRLVFLKNKLTYAYLREPKKGMLLANLAQGGKMTVVKKNKIPKKVFGIVKNVLRIIMHLNPVYYTMDFIFDESGQPYLLELNTRPGSYFAKEYADLQKKFFNKLLKVFKKL